MLEFLLIVLIILTIGVLLFLLTGFIVVKKGQIAIVERLGLYVGTYKSGIRYFAPLIYRRVGMYPIGVLTKKVDVSRFDSIFVKYEILDVKKYHYVGHHDIDGIIRLALNEKRLDDGEYMTSQFKKIGVRYISNEKMKK